MSFRTRPVNATTSITAALSVPSKDRFEIPDFSKTHLNPLPCSQITESPESIIRQKFKTPKNLEKPSLADENSFDEIQGWPLEGNFDTDDADDAASLSGSSDGGFFPRDKGDGKYLFSTLHNVEDVERYEPGGFHPVHIGDHFCDKRYKVIYKLGAGGFSTVWLARDTELSRYVSLKIVSAEASKECEDKELEIYRCIQQDSTLSTHPGRNFVSSPLDHFWFDGPNGSHICLVFQVLGPSMTRLSCLECRLRKGVDRKTSWQVTQGLAYLHSLGICHGDLTPSNILFELTEINAWSEDTIYAKFGAILKEPVETTSGEPLRPHAPTYLVEGISVSDLCLDMITEHIRIVDFGQSFRCDSPPERGMGIPMSYMAPELLFENIASTASDLWALGCTIYEIRAGRPLIHMFMGESPEETAAEIAHTLGAFPAAWNRITFGEEDCEPKCEEDDTKEMKPWIGPDQALEHPLVDVVADIEDEYPTSITDNIDDTAKSANVVSGQRESLFWKPPPQSFRVETTESGEVISTRTGERATNPLPKIAPEEASSLYDLLIRVLKYRWDERTEATELATHGWFHSQDTST